MMSDLRNSQWYLVRLPLLTQLLQHCCSQSKAALPGSQATPGEIRNSSSRSEELEPVTLLPQKGDVSSSPYLIYRPCTGMGVKAVSACQLFTFSSFTMSTPLQSPFVSATKPTCLPNPIRTPGHLLKGKSEARYRSFISHWQSHLLAFQAASLPLLVQLTLFPIELDALWLQVNVHSSVKNTHLLLLQLLTRTIPRPKCPSGHHLPVITNQLQIA